MHFLVWCLANCEKNCTAALSLKLAVEIWLCLTLTSALQVRIAEQYFLRCPRVVMKWMLSRRQRRRHVSVAAIFSAKCCLLDLLILSPLWFSFHKEFNSFFSNLCGRDSNITTFQCFMAPLKVHFLCIVQAYFMPNSIMSRIYCKKILLKGMF